MITEQITTIANSESVKDAITHVIHRNPSNRYNYKFPGELENHQFRIHPQSIWKAMVDINGSIQEVHRESTIIIKSNLSKPLFYITIGLPFVFAFIATLNFMGVPILSDDLHDFIMPMTLILLMPHLLAKWHVQNVHNDFVNLLESELRMR